MAHITTYIDRLFVFCQLKQYKILLLRKVVGELGLEPWQVCTNRIAKSMSEIAPISNVCFCACTVNHREMFQGCIPPLCDLMTVMDAKIIQVALNGLENILRLGEQDAKASSTVNPYAVLIEECYGESNKLQITRFGEQ